MTECHSVIALTGNVLEFPEHKCICIYVCLDVCSNNHSSNEENYIPSS